LPGIHSRRQRRVVIVAFWFAFSAAIIVVNRLVREG
jgi:hypothetical protein